MLELTLFFIILSMFILVVYTLKGESIWERLIGLNLIIIKIILLITVYAILIDVPSVLDISITYSIVGFIATTLLSRFLLRGGRLK
ncbi:monovalent cation/H+ antiporter complex subunit F [Fusibacter sp. JL216-2]|uniref:monovalent cation/H+ antiporter complex subunit F n=1 Tax=Fusibacter sp. JL216-2 TaxID=3071453 RepID=UPI003D33EAE9